MQSWQLLFRVAVHESSRRHIRSPGEVLICLRTARAVEWRAVRWSAVRGGSCGGCHLRCGKRRLVAGQQVGDHLCWSCSARRSWPRQGVAAWSGAEEVVVDVLLSLVAEERDDVPQARAPCAQFAGGEQVRAGAGTHKQPELAGQPAHLADRRLAVDRDYLVDEVPVPGEDAGDKTIGDALDEVPADF